MDIAGRLEAARITAARQAADTQAEAVAERIALAADFEHDAQQGALDRQHEVNLDCERDHCHCGAVALRPSHQEFEPMKGVICAVLVMLGLGASSLMAQQIYQYPFDSTVTAYGVNGITYPKLSSQIHWRPSNQTPDPTLTPQLMAPSIGHSHVECWTPIWATITPMQHQYAVNCQLILFHVNGYFYTVDSLRDGVQVDLGSGTTSAIVPNTLVWDATGTSTPPVMTGDPAGIRTWTFHFVLDPTISTGTGFVMPAHGWTNIRVFARTMLSGRVPPGADIPKFDNQLFFGMYSLMDPTQPEVIPPDQEVAFLGSVGQMYATDRGFATTVSAYKGTYAPILSTLNFPQPSARPLTYSYSQDFTPFPLGTAITRVDMDLHHGSPGTLLASAQGVGGASVPSPFDPTLYATPGVHKVAAIWQQDSGAGVPSLTPPVLANEQFSSLIVVEVTVGTGVTPAPPPPQILTIPLAVTGTSTTPACHVMASTTGTSEDGGKTFTFPGGSVACQ
jgi:hypothetical protein